MDKKLNVFQQHFSQYKKAMPQDVFKFIYQSCFGCEHMVSSTDLCIQKIVEEFEGSIENNSPFIEPLDGKFSRVNLQYLNKGLSAKTLGKIFYLSSMEEHGDLSVFEEKISTATKLSEEGFFSFSHEEFLSTLYEWKSHDYKAIHHSAEFKKQYNPSYRVISNRYVPFLPLFCKIDQNANKEKHIVSIEGGSASGKSTLSQIIKEIYSCTVFHTDDFFLQQHQRTKERIEEIGGNLDRERFKEEITSKIKENNTISYRRFDCTTMEVSERISVELTPLIIIEGVYSMHPYFSDYYHTSVFIDISTDLQKSRIKKRNPPSLQKRFFEEWIPMENKYFKHFSIKEKCDLVIPLNND